MADAPGGVRFARKLFRRASADQYSAGRSVVVSQLVDLLGGLESQQTLPVVFQEGRDPGEDLQVVLLLAVGAKDHDEHVDRLLVEAVEVHALLVDPEADDEVTDRAELRMGNRQAEPKAGGEQLLA